MGLQGAVDAENLQPWTIAVTISVTLLALVSVALRLLARREKRMKLWWDDWMIIFSMVSPNLAAAKKTNQQELGFAIQQDKNKKN